MVDGEEVEAGDAEVVEVAAVVDAEVVVVTTIQTTLKTQNQNHSGNSSLVD